MLTQRVEVGCVRCTFSMVCLRKRAQPPLAEDITKKLIENQNWLIEN